MSIREFEMRIGLSVDCTSTPEAGVAASRYAKRRIIGRLSCRLCCESYFRRIIVPNSFHMSLWIFSVPKFWTASLRRQSISSSYLFDTQFELAFARRTMATGVRQPEWQQPIQSEAADLPPLKIYNSLTRTKTPFIPIDQKKVKWYACGPTVYE